MKYLADETITEFDHLEAGEYERCTFKNGRLAGQKFAGYQFVDCTFQDTDLSNADFEHCRLQTVHFTGCKMVGTDFYDAKPFGLRLGFDKCKMELVSFLDLELKGTVFKECNLSEAVFSNTDLRKSSFADCDLSLADFESADLRNADLTGAFNFWITPSETNIYGARFSRAGLEGLVGELGIVVV